jgi:hypothetical protein
MTGELPPTEESKRSMKPTDLVETFLVDKIPEPADLNKKLNKEEESDPVIVSAEGSVTNEVTSRRFVERSEKRIESLRTELKELEERIVYLEAQKTSASYANDELTKHQIVARYEEKIAELNLKKANLVEEMSDPSKNVIFERSEPVVRTKEQLSYAVLGMQIPVAGAEGKYGARALREGLLQLRRSKRFPDNPETVKKLERVLKIVGFVGEDGLTEQEVKELQDLAQAINQPESPIKLNSKELYQSLREGLEKKRAEALRTEKLKPSMLERIKRMSEVLPSVLRTSSSHSLQSDNGNYPEIASNNINPTTEIVSATEMEPILPVSGNVNASLTFPSALEAVPDSETEITLPPQPAPLEAPAPAEEISISAMPEQQLESYRDVLVVGGDNLTDLTYRVFAPLIENLNFDERQRVVERTMAQIRSQGAEALTRMNFTQPISSIDLIFPGERLDLTLVHEVLSRNLAALENGTFLSATEIRPTTVNQGLGVEAELDIKESTENVIDPSRESRIFVTPQAVEKYKSEYQGGEDAWQRDFETYIRTYLPKAGSEGWLSNWFSVGAEEVGDIYEHIASSGMTISEFNEWRDGDARQLRENLRKLKIPIARFRELQTMLYEIGMAGNVQMSDNMTILSVLEAAFVVRHSSLVNNQ